MNARREVWRGVGVRLALFGVWLALVVFMSSRHVFWRDEGRALSIALQGDGLGEMLVRLRGEGHPAVWYVLLRVAHTVIAGAAVLPVVAISAMSVAVLMLLFLSPFPLWLMALVLATGPFLFEYSVMARNYGISAPLIFGIAALYPRFRERGVWIGALAAVLANTNAHSVLVVGGLLLMWLLDLAFERGLGWNRATGRWALNAAVAAVGIGVSALTLYPPVNDGAVAEGVPGLRVLLAAVLVPASTFDYLSVFSWAEAFGLRSISPYPSALFRALSPVLFGSLAGLIRWPAGLIGGAATMVATSLFFRIVYPGGYRHQAIWLLMLIGLYWMLRQRPVGPVAGGSWLATRVGFRCFVLLLALQVPAGIGAVVDAVRDEEPFSQVRRVAEALQARPDLREAIVIADPDWQIEAFPLYAANPIYLPRSRAFAKVSPLSNRGLTAISLGDLLTDAQALCRAERRPVALAMLQDLRAAALPAVFAEGYAWSLSVSVAEYAALTGSTEFLGRFAPSRSGEEFSVYVLRPPCTVRWSG